MHLVRILKEKRKKEGTEIHLIGNGISRSWCRSHEWRVIFRIKPTKNSSDVYIIFTCRNWLHLNWPALLRNFYYTPDLAALKSFRLPFISIQKMFVPKNNSTFNYESSKIVSVAQIIISLKQSRKSNVYIHQKQ